VTSSANWVNLRWVQIWRTSNSIVPRNYSSHFDITPRIVIYISTIKIAKHLRPVIWVTLICYSILLSFLSPIILRCLLHEGAIPNDDWTQLPIGGTTPHHRPIYLHRDIRDLIEVHWWFAIHTGSGWAASRSNQSDFLRWPDKGRELNGKWHVAKGSRVKLGSTTTVFVIQFLIFI
jgi:hypothetical protein